MIYSIGTSNRSLGEFLHALQKHAITQIIDLRSSPYSRQPWFNREQIVRWSERAGIMYREEGEVLGGRSAHDPTSAVYRQALERLLSASYRETIAIFCAEGDPRECHRSYEVGAAILAEHGVIVRNILRDGRLEDVPETLARTPMSRVPDHLRSKIETILRRDLLAEITRSGSE